MIGVDRAFVELWSVVAFEWGLNRGIRLRLLVVLFRLAAFGAHGGKLRRLALLPVLVLYRFYSEFLLSTEIPPSARIGRGLRIYHPAGIVVHPDVVIGENCILRQGVTIGNKGDGAKSRGVPVIGDHVQFGAGCVVVGAITVGSRSLIGANAVVCQDVPEDAVVYAARPHVEVRCPDRSV